MSCGWAKLHRGDFWTWTLGLAAVSLLAWFGWSAAEFNAKVADVEMRNQLLEQTVQIATNVNLDLASKLTFTEADLGTPAYECLREQLIGYGRAIPGARWLYCMTKRNGRIIFGLDVGFGNAEKPAQPAKPGEVYEDPSPQFEEMFDQKRPFTDGPCADKWGTFVSACVPVFNQHTGKLVMLIGLDIEVNDWNARLNAARREPLLVTAAMIFFLAAGIVLIRRWNRQRTPNSLKLKAWIIVPVALASLVGLAFLGVYEYRVSSEESRRNALFVTEQASAECDQHLNAEVQLLKAQIDRLADNHELLRAWQHRDRAELIAASQPVFEELKRTYDITYLYFIEPNRTCFLRSHDFGRYGDSLDRATMATAAYTGEDAWGTEVGTVGNSTLRYVHPWRRDGRLIGYLELGVEISRLADQLAQVIDAEVLTVIRKRYISRERYEAEQKRYGLKGQWDDYPDYVLVHQTVPHLADAVMRKFVDSNSSTPKPNVFEAQLGDKRFACGTIQLPDGRGCDIVSLVVVRDITIQSAAASASLLWSMSIASVMIGGILVLLWSITGAAERQLSDAFTTIHASRERFAQVAETSGEMIWEVDADGVYTYVSHVCETLLGYSKDQLIGKLHFCDLHPEKGRAEFLHCVEELVKRKQPFKDFLKPVIAKDGRTLTTLSSGVPILDANGNLLGYRGSSKDITERQQAEDDLIFAKAELQEYVTALEFSNQALQEANRLAEAATRAKSEFLANMSHEIRTPMTAILGYADIMLEEDVCRGLREYVEVIKHNGKHLLELVNDILDLSKVEAGKMEIDSTRCSPIELLNEVVSLMQVRADAKHLKFTTEFLGPIPETILTDPLRLRQILVNLVGNAIKFTDEGEIRLAAQLTSKGGNTQLRINVTDTGIGMDPAEIGRLFQAFTQVDNSATRKFGGSGMGLFISRRLAEILGGNIEVESRPGRGSTFSVTIDPGPLEGIRMLAPGRTAFESQPNLAPAAEPSAPLRSRVLLVEDGLDNQRLIRLFIKKAGGEVVAVENGQLAVERVVTAAEIGEPFDVILMDMQMPVMDGYTATQRLREWGYAGPIVALTAHAMDHDCQKCLDAGCDDYTTKPVDRQKLLATIAYWTDHGRSKQHPANRLDKGKIAELP